MINQIIFFLYSSLFFFTPLVMSSLTSELFEFNKMIFIYIIAVLLLFFWLLKCLTAKKIFWVRTIFDGFILLFIISQVLSTLFSIDVYTSILGYYGRFNGGLLSTLTYLSLFYILIVFFDFNKLEKLLKLSVISSLVVIIWGLPGRFGLDMSCLAFVGQLNNSCWTDQFRPAERMFSTLGQPNWLGAYLAINFFIAAYFQIISLLRSNKEKKINWVFIYYSSYLILNFLSVLFTRSRSALAALMVGIFILVVYFLLVVRKELKNPNWKIYGAIIAGAMIILTFIFKTGVEKIDSILSFQFVQPQKTTKSVQLPVSVANKDNITNSLDIRKIVWQGAWDLGKKYPVFGTGLETFGYAYYFVRPAAHNLTSEWDYLYNKAHNEYLNYLATTGFVGLFTYLSMILAVLCLLVYQLIKEKSAEDRLFYLCLLLSYLTILITNIVGFSITAVNLFFYLIPGFYLIKLQDKKKCRPVTINFENQSGLSFYFFQPLAWIMTGVFLIFSLRYLVLYYLADLKYAQANNLMKVNRLQEAANGLDEAIKMHYEHVYEDKFSYVLANVAYAASYQNQKDLANKLIELSKFYNEKSLKASSKNVLYWKTKAKNQYLFYQIDLDQKEIEKGVQALLKAQQLAPTDVKIPYSLALFYSLLYDANKDQAQLKKYQELSLSEINKTIILKSDMRDAYFLKGQLLKKYKQNKEAKAVFEFLLKNFDPQNEEVKKEIQGL